MSSGVELRLLVIDLKRCKQTYGSPFMCWPSLAESLIQYCMDIGMYAGNSPGLYGRDSREVNRHPSAEDGIVSLCTI